MIFGSKKQMVGIAGICLVMVAVLVVLLIPQSTSFAVFHDPVWIDENGNGVFDSGEWNGTLIQAAVDNASKGDTIYVGDGIYNENVDVNKQVTIQSANGSEN